MCVDDARAAMTWYGEVLGAEVTFEPIVMEDGRVGHVELAVGDARWMMSEPFADVGVEAPDHDRGAAVTLHLEVTDVDALAAKVTASGITLDRGPDSTPHGRI